MINHDLLFGQMKLLSKAAPYNYEDQGHLSRGTAIQSNAFALLSIDLKCYKLIIQVCTMQCLYSPAWILVYFTSHSLNHVLR